VVDDARGRVVDEREERGQQGRVSSGLVGGRDRSGEELRIVDEPPRGSRELGQVLGLGLQRVIERCGDGARLRPPPSVTRDT